MKQWIKGFSILLFAGMLKAQVPGWSPGEGSQREEVAQWTYDVISVGEDQFDLVFEARLSKGWVLYSTRSAPGGSLPAEFEYPQTGVELMGEIEEGVTHEKFQEVFGVTETFFKERAYFRQRVRLTDPGERNFEVLLFYQVCENDLCIAQDRSFGFEVVRRENRSVIQVSTKPKKSTGLGDPDRGGVPGFFRLPLRDREMLGQQAEPSRSGIAWDILLKGLIGGLIAVFTPCVLPLVPLTVNFFSRDQEAGRSNRYRALIYAFFIAGIYLLFSLPFHLIRGLDPQLLNGLATNVWMNLAFFAVFLIFALSFFGWFELRLPTSWGMKADRAAETARGPLGIFFMALTLVIVSFSCTGPILGLLLGSTALGTGDVAANLSMGMLGFGLGLALPFSMLSFFPGWLKRIPRSGGWMEFIKITLAFLELALAIKFLSNADLVGNWNLLKREVFIGLWMLILLAYGLFLGGVLKFPRYHFEKGSMRWRYTLITLITFCFLYLGGGLYGNSSLKNISGLLPPDFYSLKEKSGDCPLGLDCYKDFKTGLAVAQRTDKPLLLDFTGWACANCRQMEQDVWSRPDIFRILKEDVVLISLYTDDRTRLSVDDQFEIALDNGLNKRIQTVGQLWGTFQFLNFGAISQPYYILLSPDLEVLSPAKQSSGATEYRSWLISGIERHRKESLTSADSKPPQP